MLKWYITIPLKHTPKKKRAQRVPHPKGVGTNNLKISEHLGRLRARLLLCSFLSFKVGDCEASTIWETHILDADEFPTFFAQAVQVILNVFHYWLAASFKVVCMNPRLYRYNRVFPSHHFNHHLLRLHYYSSSPKSSPS
jgi:hypothetical protein